MGHQEDSAVGSLKHVIDNHRVQGLDLVKTMTEIFRRSGLSPEVVRGISDEMTKLSPDSAITAKPLDHISDDPITPPIDARTPKP